MFCTVLHIVRLKERSGYKSHFSIPRLRSYKRTGLYSIFFSQNNLIKNEFLFIYIDLIFALANIDETIIHLVPTNEQVASFDLDWLTKNIF
jgi:hypothetical protein